MAKIMPIRPAQPQSEPGKKWNHAFSVGFSILGQHTGATVTEEDLLKGMEKRIKHLRANRNEIFAACGFPEESDHGEDGA